jgi:hypothetical protein
VITVIMVIQLFSQLVDLILNFGYVTHGGPALKY